MINRLNKETVPYVIFFIVTLGTVFCRFDVFIYPEVKSKWYWLYASVSIACLAHIFLGSNRLIRPKHYVYLLAILIVYCFFRAITGPFWLSFIILCLSLYLIYCLTGGIMESHRFKYMSFSFAASAFLLAIYGIAQYANLLHSGEIFKVIGSFDNPAGYASMLTFSTPFILYFTLSKARFLRRSAWIVYTVVFTAIVLSGSRTGILTVVILTVVYVVKRYKSWISNLHALSKTIGVFIVIIVISSLYYVKKDSTNGRLLVWKCTWNMIKDKPVLGHGYKSFDAEYMLYQADYFKQNPESKFAVLADNVIHPFNEFLLLIAEFGIVAFLLLMILIAAYTRMCLKNKDNESFILLLAWLAILIFSCFSYPLKYPFTWLVIGFCSGALPASSICKNEHFQKFRYATLPVALLSVTLLGFTIKESYYENRWYKIMNKTNPKNTYRNVSGYQNLYPILNKNPYFLYSFAVKLNHAGDYNKSNEIVIESEKISNDYDVQMLKADNYKKQRDFDKAKDCYILASQMCPGRFIPLYELVTVYDSINQPDMALQIANKIVDKPVKISSATVSAIKIMMKERIDNRVHIE